MLKGDMEILPSEIGALVYVGFVVSIVVLVIANVIMYSSTLANSKNELAAIDVSHIAENCLKEKARFLQKERLDEIVSQGKKNLCDIESCSVCGGEMGIMIKDMETGDSWDFGYDEDSKHKHSIYVNIMNGSDVHIGRLYASA